MRRVLGITIVVMAIVGLLGFTCRIPGRNYFKAKRVNAAVKASFPLGTEKSIVLSFLDVQGIEHSGYYKDGEGSDSGIINAIVRNTAWGFLCNADLQMNFIFDAQGKLERYDIDQSGTGP